jgi:predicted RNase H-like HicB family nuclease
MKLPERLRGFSFTVDFRPIEDGWWFGRCREVPEAITQGETLEEARENLTDAVAFMLEDYTPTEIEILREQLEQRDRGEHLEFLPV